MEEEEISDMQRCVDAEDFDGLLQIVSPDEIAIAWHRYRNPPPGMDEDPPDWWAFELFQSRLIFKRRDLYRSLLLKLVEHAPDDRLGHVGAGPLENFVSDNEDDLAWLQASLQTHPRLAIALRNVWCDGDVTAETMARLDALAGQPLKRLPPRADRPAVSIAYEGARNHFDAVAGGPHGFSRLTDPTPEQRDAAAVYRQATSDLFAWRPARPPAPPRP